MIGASRQGSTGFRLPSAPGLRLLVPAALVGMTNVSAPRQPFVTAALT